MTSAGKMASTVYSFTNNVTSYFNLRDINEDLQFQNARLESEVIALREKMALLSEKIYGDTMTVSDSLRHCKFIIATVVNNSISRTNNYITINKGLAQGVLPEMGVVDQNGVVGIVNLVNDNYARIISLLNPDFSLSCKVNGSDAFGSLIWDGKSYDEAIIEGLPRHTVYTIGDTIMTSGYSAVFPPGIPVGIIMGTVKTMDDNFYTLRIKLLTDFSQLSTVRVISDPNLEERRLLEMQSGKQI